MSAVATPGWGVPGVREHAKEAARPGPGPILEIFVVGTPRPKGSMRPLPGYRMKEDNKRSPDWRLAVVEAAYKRVGCNCPDRDCGAMRPGYPELRAVEVWIALYFDKPKSAPKKREILPTTRTTGDLDKQARNIFDALQDARVFKDDSQVVSARVSKRYCGPLQVPGAHITVWPVEVGDA